MKSFLLRVLVSLVPAAWPLVSEAGFALAKGVYRFDDFAVAQAKAQAENKPLTFLISDESTSCGLCTHASKLAMEEFRKKTVMVYVPPGSLNALPLKAKMALLSERAGRYIPITIITDPAVEEVLAIIPFARSPEYDQLLNRADRDVSRRWAERTASKPINPAAAPAPAAAPSAPVAPREIRTWTSTSGAEVEARFVRQEGEWVFLEKADLTPLRIRVGDLSPADREWLAAQRTLTRTP